MTLGSGIDERARGPAFAVLAPMVSLALITVIAILPWGVPNSLRFVPPMLPLAVVYYWTLNRRGWMPALLVACVGLFVDLVTYGPLGFWSSTFLLGQLFAHWMSGALSQLRLTRLGGFAFSVVVICGLQWLTASIYFVHWAAWQPFAYAAVGVILAYPLISLLFAPASE